MDAGASGLRCNAAKISLETRFIPDAFKILDDEDDVRLMVVWMPCVVVHDGDEPGIGDKYVTVLKLFDERVQPLGHRLLI